MARQISLKKICLTNRSVELFAPSIKVVAVECGML